MNRILFLEDRVGCSMKFIITTFLLLLFGMALNAQEKSIYSTKAGAIKGYDPVAYFTQGQAIEGSAKFSYQWMDAIWYFSNQTNLDAFKSDPEKYAPQFGGYCAYAVSQGYTYRSDPQAWKIVNGKLYLNYDKKIQTTWEANQSVFINAGHQNWPGVLGKE